MSSKKYRKLRSFFWDLLESTPIISAVILTSFSIAAVLFLLLGNFNQYYILALGGILALPASIYVFKRHRNSEKLGSQHERRLVIVCLLVFVGLWVGINSFFNAKHVFTNRDPATYTIGAKWLKENEDLNIKKLKNLDVVDGVVSDSAGFGASKLNGTDLYAQGSHLLPALLAFPAKLADSDKLIFNTNIAIGGIAILAVFALGSMIMKPRWALLASITLSLTLPMVYFSRDTYTEPLAMALIFSAMALIIMAARQKDNWLWLIAGLTIGSSSMARIDAYIPIAAVLVFITLYVIIGNSSDLIKRLSSSLIFIFATAATSIIGFVDAYLLSSGYFRDQWHNISMELLLILAIISVGVAGYFMARKTSWLEKLNSATKKWRGKWVFWTIMATWLLLMSRPLWLEVTNSAGDRTYAEHTTYWLMWYVGAVIILLGMAAVAFVIRKILNGNRLYLALTLLTLVVMSSALLYLIRPSIYSDQVWASRRQLMVIMPGMILFGFLALGYIYDNVKKLPGIVKKANTKVLVAVVATLATVTPLIASMPFLLKASYSQLEAVNVMCEKLPKDSAVLLVGTAYKESIMPLRSFCGIDAVGFNDSNLEIRRQPTRKHLVEFYQAAKAASKQPLIMVYGYEKSALIGEGVKVSEIALISYQNVEFTNIRPPLEMTQFRVNVLVGKVTKDGSIILLR